MKAARASSVVTTAAISMVIASLLVNWRKKVLRRRRKNLMKEVEDEKLNRAKVVAACKELLEKEIEYEGMVNEVLAHLAVEGSLQLREVRDSDGKIDYGSSDAPVALLKIDSWYITPTAILPTPIDADFYRVAKKISSGAIIRVLDRVTTNWSWLQQTFSELAKADDWTRIMLQLAKLDDGGKRIRCHVIRSDYMHDEPTRRVVNIEVNTFAASLAGPADACTKAHQRLIAKMLHAQSFKNIQTVLPSNKSAQGIADTLAQAVFLYAKKFYPYQSLDRANLAVLFVTIAEEDNECCHRHVEKFLFDKYKIISLRYTISQLIKRRQRSTNKTLLDPNAKIFLPMSTTAQNEKEIALVYFRLCRWERYGLDGWDVRSDLAHATCVEVPSAAAHLAGLKRAQVEWSSRSGLIPLGLSENDIKDITAVAVPQFALDDPATALRAQSTVNIDTRRGFVAKPARDGYLDMAHIFGRKKVLDLCAKAIIGTDSRAKGLVIQALARPKPRPSLVLTAKQLNVNNNSPSDDKPIAHLRPSVPELGIFVTAVIDAFQKKDKIDEKKNYSYRYVQAGQPIGHLVRSKHSDTNDGGLCRGNAIVDSPLLFDDSDSTY